MAIETTHLVAERGLYTCDVCHERLSLEHFKHPLSINPISGLWRCIDCCRRYEQNQNRPHIRWLIRRDMAEVLAIENASFDFPWKESDFVRCLRQRNVIAQVAERGERVVGFMLFELHKDRKHLLNFAVHQNFRRRQIGTAMIEKLQGSLSGQRRYRLVAEVRESNVDALLFFKAMDFVAVSVLRDFYEDTEDNAVVMQYRLPLDDRLPDRRGEAHG